MQTYTHPDQDPDRQRGGLLRRTHTVCDVAIPSIPSTLHGPVGSVVYIHLAFIGTDHCVLSFDDVYGLGTWLVDSS